MFNLKALAVVSILLAGHSIAAVSPTVIVANNAANVSDGIGFFNNGVGGSLTVNWASGNQNIGLIQFDLSQFSTASQVHADLNLFQGWNAVPNAQFGVFRNTTSWVGNTSNWASRPSIAATPSAILAINDSFTQKSRSVDVSNLVQGWINGSYANYGLSLIRLDSDNPKTYFAATTANGGFVPNLSVAPVPEPETYALMGMGLLGLMAARRRKMK